MRIHLLSVGTKMPQWVTAGYLEYAKRLPQECALHLLEIPLGRRGKGLDPRRAVVDEGTRILKAIPTSALVIALEVDGHAWSTTELSIELGQWLAAGRDVALLVGGPDGLSAACVERASTRWSISCLTFPHPLVRVIVAEQLYRAWSLLQHHPYHRA